MKTMRENCLAFMSDLQQRDVRFLDKWFSEESTVWIPPSGPIQGKRKILILFRTIFSKYRMLRWNVQQIHEVSPFRCIYITESWGETKSGEHYKNHIITDIVFNELGQVVCLSDYFKHIPVNGTVHSVSLPAQGGACRLVSTRVRRNDAS